MSRVKAEEGWYLVHVLIDWVGDIARPHRLYGTDTTIGAYVAPEAAAGNDFTQTIDVGAKRES